MRALRIAVADWVDEWPSSVCLVVGVAAATIPLMLLLSIRFGLVSHLRGELTRLPSSRELVTINQPLVSWRLIERLKRRTDVAFAEPLTAFLAASVLLHREGAVEFAEVDLVPSGAADPLAPWRPGRIAIPESLAAALQLRPGQMLRLEIERSQGNVHQRGVIRLRVGKIIPASRFATTRKFVLVSPQLLLATEIWRSRPEIATFEQAFAEAGNQRENWRYSGIRLYARDVDSVDTLRLLLLRDAVDTESRVDEIRVVQNLDRGLTTLLAVLSGVIGLGLSVSLASAQWAWVERRRADLSYLRLIGMRRSGLMQIPMWQAALTVGAGLTLAIGVCWVVHLIVNRLFLGQLGELTQVSVIRLVDVGLVAALAGVAGLLAALVAAAMTQRISPIIALRGG